MKTGRKCYAQSVIQRLLINRNTVPSATMILTTVLSTISLWERQGSENSEFEKKLGKTKVHDDEAKQFQQECFGSKSLGALILVKVVSR